MNKLGQNKNGTGKLIALGLIAFGFIGISIWFALFGLPAMAEAEFSVDAWLTLFHW